MTFGIEAQWSAANILNVNYTRYWTDKPNQLSDRKARHLERNTPTQFWCKFVGGIPLKILSKIPLRHMYINVN